MRWLLLCSYLSWSFRESCSRVIIETIPPTPSHLIAKNYSGLIIRAIFMKAGDTTDCAWENAGTGVIVNSNTPAFTVTGLGCVNRTDSSEEKITCVEKSINGVTYIFTNFSYLKPLTSNVDRAVRCQSGETLIASLPNKQVKDCPVALGYGVVVTADTYTYNQNGMFTCGKYSTLFYANGTKPATSLTTCLYTAEWSGKDNLQCWIAPKTTICSKSTEYNLLKINANQENNLSLKCLYDDVIPPGHLSIFYFDDEAKVIEKGEEFIISSLQLSDNEKQISCQAVTPYTQLYNQTGRSPNYTINVQYISDRVVAEAFPSPYLIKSGIGYLIQSGQAIVINCSSYGNPEPQCALSLCWNMVCENITNAKNDCLISKTITQDSSFSCLAHNIAGSLNSVTQPINVISKSRSVNVISTGNLTKTRALIRRKGDTLDLTCNIDHSDILNTTFVWKYGSGTKYSNSKLNLSSLSPAHGGNYTCFTQDAFGNFNTTIYIDVLSAPIFEAPISCSWKVNENGICEVKFMSNPASSFVSAIKNNTGLGIYNISEDEVELSSNSNFEQVFIFKSKQVTLGDAGKYELNLYYPMPPHNHKIMFEILLTDDDDTLVIALSAAGGTCLLLVVVFLLWICKPWESKGKIKGGSSSHKNQAFEEDGRDNQSDKDIASPLHATSIHATDGDTVYAAVAKNNKKTTASKGKEEKFNPLYGTTTQADATEPAYGVVDKTRKKKRKKLPASTEKEEKSNPLYASSSHTEEVEPAYGVVDKSKKKSKAAPGNKQTKTAASASLEPTNQPEETYAAVERKQKKKKATVGKASENGVRTSMSKDRVVETNEEVENKYGQNNQTEQDSVYAEVRKPKKKKKKRQITQQSAESGGSTSAFHDVTLHGTTQQE